VKFDRKAIRPHNRGTVSCNEKEGIVLTVDLDTVDLPERGPGLRVAFPITSAEGAAAIATVWMELEPGGVLAEHTDSAEELLFVVEGEVEASVGEERGVMRAGELAVVPSLVPHGLRNLSDRRARILGVFASATNIAVFTEPKGPDGERIFVIGAPIPLMSHLEAPVPVG
jgi:quercetin dioxygenase-like cupin family protein